MPSITIRVSPALHESLTRKCEERGIPLSDLVRELLDRVDDAMMAQHMRAYEETYVAPSVPPPPRRLVHGIAKGIRGFSLDGEPLPPRGPMQKGAKK